ncbi:MAG: hypothetical protein JNL38_17315 [Myxococcales bacterium]|jgi:hypothetical protein|nr:hypothetical protein [Myxococcales bacterium]
MASEAEDALEQILARATSHAEETVARPIAFVLLVGLDDRETLHRVIGAADSSEVLRVGYSTVAESRDVLRAFVIAYDAYMPREDGTRADAIFFQCGLRGVPHTSVIARPYLDDGERVSWTEGPALLRRIDGVLPTPGLA